MKKTKYFSFATTAQWMIAIFLLYIFFMKALNYVQIKKTLRNVERTNIEQILKENAPTLATLRYYQFDTEFKEILQQLQKNNQSILSLSYTQHKPKPKANQIVIPLLYKNQTIGYLVATYRYKLVEQFFHTYNLYFLFFLVSLFIFALAFAIFLSRKIRSLRTLSNRVEHLNPTHFQKLQPIDNYKEIVVITQAINKLLLTVFHYIQHIKLNEQHLKDAQKIANMSSWEYHENSNRFICSDQLYRTFNISKKQKKIDWKLFLSSMDPVDRVKFLDDLQAAKRSNHTFEDIIKFRLPKGEKYLKNVVKVRNKRDSTVIIGTALDVTEEIKAKKEVEYLAFHDSLTALPNRASFQQTVENYAKIAKRRGERFAIIFLDLDNFKFINDTYGHDAGDYVLIQTAKALQQTLRKSDLIFRIGGDEFVIMATNIQEKSSLFPILDKIKQNVTVKYRYKKHQFTISCSLGVAIFPEDSEDIETVIQYADLAMYEAKRSGKNSYRFFELGMKKILEQLQKTSQELKEALQKEDEIQLYFQPKIDMKTGMVLGAEALIRWLHPTKGVIYPNEFIPLAEKSDLIIEVDKYVMKKSFEYMASWAKDPLLRHLSLSINISAKHFRNPSLIAHLQKYLQHYKIDPKLLEIEITETLSMEDTSYTLSTLKSIKELGFKVDLDDFGTGYSSLNYLKKIPFDTIKIDRSFIQDIHQDPDDLQITKIIIDIAKIFNKSLLAEGVETKEHEKILLDIGCRCAQGYLYSKPLSLDKFIQFVKERN